jgi:hypothetical protein
MRFKKKVGTPEIIYGISTTKTRRSVLVMEITDDYCNNRGDAVAQWLRHCATNRKVVGSIYEGVIGIFN